MRNQTVAKLIKA